MTNTTTLLISLTALLAGVSATAAPMPVRAVQPQPNGMTLVMPSGALRLQALRPRIVHVTYSPTGAFPAPRVPTVIGRFPPTPFRLTQSAQAVTLATGLMRAQVDRKTGAVRFLDAGLCGPAADGRGDLVRGHHGVVGGVRPSDPGRAELLPVRHPLLDHGHRRVLCQLPRRQCQPRIPRTVHALI